MFDEEKKKEMPVEEEELEEPIEEPIEDKPEPATEEPIEEAPHEKEELGPVEEIILEIPEKKKPWWKFW